MTVEKNFYIEDYLLKRSSKETAKKKNITSSATIDKQERFEKICKEVEKYFNQEWETENGQKSESSDELLKRHKNAIIGYIKEVNYFKDKINEFLKKNSLANEWYPENCYENLTDAIFQENWGLAGIAAWKLDPHSSSAKIIGEKIFYLDEGEQVLQEQKISAERFKKLRKALLLRNPEKRFDEDYTEVYMLDGTRITIFDEPLAKEPAIIFRKYIVENYSFEEQAARGTIPSEIIPMLEAMVKIGYNVNFLGAVRTAKTTMLQTWQSYENPKLEGIQVETDPEVPTHKLMPTSPIIQLVADGEKLRKLIKMLMRGDADYLIMAEARDGVALYIAVTVANKGTRRVKSTFHTSDPADFCFDAANEIIKEFGGDLYMTIVKVAKSYHYLFEMIQLKDKSKKRLNAIYELRWNGKKHEISLHQICKYDHLTDSWTFRYDLGEDKEQIGQIENPEALAIFKNELKSLEEKYPMDDQFDHITIPYYNLYMRK